jgi:hypothetical protein
MKKFLGVDLDLWLYLGCIALVGMVGTFYAWQTKISGSMQNEIQSVTK